MRIAFLYNRSAEDPAQAAEDEFPNGSPVVAALKRLGHTVVPIACTLNFTTLRRRLLRVQPDIVFNRVESLGGSDSMMAAVTLLLDSMQIPYTGNSTAALVAAASKVAVKKRLVEAGLPTPRWIERSCLAKNENTSASAVPTAAFIRGKYIFKSDLEHASFEIDDASVVSPQNHAEAQRMICDREMRTGRTYFGEEFIDGREFNISVLGAPPKVLPPAEIDFSAFPSDKLRIVGHRAKWDESSFEYHNTERLFEHPPADEPMLRRLTELTKECWRLFGLAGYARVDFRCDNDRQPWILEVNTNPCISPDAGFAAALEFDGIGYDGGLALILEDAMSRRPSSGSAVFDARAPCDLPQTSQVHGRRTVSHA